MQKLEDIFRFFLFMICFAAGLCAIALVFLGPEWQSLYQLKAAVQQTERNNKKIENIINDHKVLTSQINSDPEILKKIAPVTLGIDPCDANQPPVKITPETLAAAKSVLQQQEQNSGNPSTPKWLLRCTTDENRIVLFSAGAGLIVVSFACFGKRKENKGTKKQNR